jgi:hypothetical protein
MTATLAASQAVLKRKYPGGKLPTAMYASFPFLAMLAKEDNWDGDDRVIAIQTEACQGASSDFNIALGSLAQGKYYRFLPTRVEHFSLARIKGQALRAARNGGALVDLWNQETDGAAMTEMKCLEIYAMGNGSGVLGQTTSGHATVTVTLTIAEDISKFDLGMRVGAVSTNTLSPTVRTGYATITAISRDTTTATITTSAAWNTLITGFVANDYLVRAGDEASGGVGKVITGTKQWIAGGATPGTLFGLDRNPDPVRLAGQSRSATAEVMEDAIMESESRRNFQGQRGKLTAWANTRNLVQLKKSLNGKVQYPKQGTAQSNVAGISFRTLEFEGDFDTIRIMSHPFIDKNDLQLLQMDTFTMASLGGTPTLLNFDQNDFLRVANDDAYEVRFGVYGNALCRLPSASIITTNWGA